MASITWCRCYMSLQSPVLFRALCEKFSWECVAGLPWSKRPQATNVLVIKLYFIKSRAGASMPETRQNTHHRQYNTALLLIITFVTPHHLAHVSATPVNPAGATLPLVWENSASCDYKETSD